MLARGNPCHIALPAPPGTPVAALRAPPGTPAAALPAPPGTTATALPALPGTPVAALPALPGAPAAALPAPLCVTGVLGSRDFYPLVPKGSRDQRPIQDGSKPCPHARVPKGPVCPGAFLLSSLFGSSSVWQPRGHFQGAQT